LIACQRFKFLEKELLGNPFLRSDALNKATAKVTGHPEYVEKVRSAVVSWVEKSHLIFVIIRYIKFSLNAGEWQPSPLSSRTSEKVHYFGERF
jgi:hypothetical protein